MILSNEYLERMPKISDSVFPSSEHNIKVPVFTIEDNKEIMYEESTKIEKLIQSNSDSGIMMFKTVSKNSRQSGCPIITNVSKENEVVGLALHKMMEGVGSGITLKCKKCHQSF